MAQVLGFRLFIRYLSHLSCSIFCLILEHTLRKLGA